MKQDRPYVKIEVTRKGENSIRAGHPWIYEAEVVHVDGTYANGELVDVLNSKGRYLGTGLINNHSKIRIRLISNNTNDKFDEAFWERRLRYAWDYRKTVMKHHLSCCRIIFGEADQFPGLTVDRFNDVLVTQTLCLGIEKIKGILFPLLVKILREDGERISAIYERNDVAIRELEGLTQYKGFFPLTDEVLPENFSTKTTIRENGIDYIVDFENGQKTGFFLDQKFNRQAVADLSYGKHVLDCFTHTGSFALNAAYAGAAHVHAVDISQDAIKMAQCNACRNSLESRMSFEVANVFELLTEMANEKKHDYDFIILDPPAFTKSRKTIHNAARGYKEINMKAMKLLPRGGYLATCSCSHFMSEELFCKMLHDAAMDAAVTLRQIEARQQSPDHPILWNVPETNYLKFYIFQIV